MARALLLSGPMHLVAVAIALATVSGCAAAILPPSQTQIGPALISRGGSLATGVKLATGAHWASSLARNPRFDLGVGYVFERTSDTGVGPELGVARELMPRDETEHVRMAHGTYLDVARRVMSGANHRAWVGLRGEALWSGGRDVPDLGVAARFAWELHGSGSGAGGFSDSCGGGFGFAHGTSAIGAYLESGYRVTPEGGAELVSTAGLSFRLPLMGGVGWNLCPN